jgi:hypothetical protein
MSRKDQSVLKFWDKFIKAYVSHHDYWYFPKARAVNNVAEVREIFRVLADFQGPALERGETRIPESLADQRAIRAPRQGAERE